MTVAFFATVLLGLYWKRANEYGACAGMISGIILYILIDILTKKGIIPNPFPYSHYCNLVFTLKTHICHYLSASASDSITLDILYP